MCTSMRWYLAGGLLALAGIACTVVGDLATKREVTAEVWDETTKKAEPAEHGVHGVSGE